MATRGVFLRTAYIGGAILFIYGSLATPVVKHQFITCIFNDVQLCTTQRVLFPGKNKKREERADGALGDRVCVVYGY